MASAANDSYSFFRTEEVLVRRAREGQVERLVNGRWIEVDAPSEPEDDPEWKELNPDELCDHARQYFVADFGAEPVAKSEKEERWKRSRLWQHGNPPMKGGSPRRLSEEMFDRSQRAYAGELEETAGRALAELKDEALLGYEHQRERIAAVEQRANFFLGTAGLTTRSSSPTPASYSGPTSWKPHGGFSPRPRCWWPACVRSLPAYGRSRRRC